MIKPTANTPYVASSEAVRLSLGKNRVEMIVAMKP
jgi:hypothetical protein